MAWFKKPELTKLSAPKMKDRIPEGLMVKCESCVNLVLKEQFEQNLWVCPKCDHHTRLNSAQRIAITFDSFEEDNLNLQSTDPLHFVDSKPYSERLVAYRSQSGLSDACVTGAATLLGFEAIAAVMDVTFAGGSMGSVVGEKVARAIERGLAEGKPVIVVCCGGGARMQEGILSLMQMAKTSAAVARLGEAGIPFITLLTNPTTGGTMASFASLGDIILAEPQALIGFAGPRVIQQTIKQILPKDFQTAEFVRDKGFIDMVVHRRDVKTTLAKCLSYLSGQVNPAFPPPPPAGVIDAREIV